MNTWPEGAPKGQTTMILTFSPPKAAETIQPHLTRALIDDMLPGSITQSLLGAIPPTDMTLDEIRAERLQKYDRPH
jgi:hypothetical protein